MAAISPLAPPGVTAVQAIRARTEQAEVHKAGRDTRNDGDADDAGATAPVSTPVAASANPKGQAAGSVLNILV